MSAHLHQDAVPRTLTALATHGWGANRIAKRLHLARNTVRRYSGGRRCGV